MVDDDVKTEDFPFYEYVKNTDDFGKKLLKRQFGYDLSDNLINKKMKEKYTNTSEYLRKIHMR